MSSLTSRPALRAGGVVRELQTPGHDHRPTDDLEPRYRFCARLTRHAAERLWQADCGALPVVDDTGRPVAMITDRDICMATWSRDARPQDLRVADAMSHSLTTCRESDSVSTGEAAMRVAQVRRLPIVNGEGVLVGVLSLADVARAFGTQTASPLTSASDSIVTLARICDRPTASAA